jgi:hypothetical protein
MISHAQVSMIGFNHCPLGVCRMMQREGRYPLWLASILANNTGSHRRCWHLAIPGGFVSTDLKTGIHCGKRRGVWCCFVLGWVV